MLNFLLVIFLINIYDCIKQNKASDNLSVNLVSFLDGSISAYGSDGQYLWSQQYHKEPLINIHQELDSNTKSSPIILPTDDGSFEFIDHSSNTHYVFDLDWILTHGDEINVGEYFVTSEKVVNVFAVNLLTGKLLYECIGQNCHSVINFQTQEMAEVFNISTKNHRHYNPFHNDSSRSFSMDDTILNNTVLIIKKIQLIVHLYESFTGKERWNLSLGKHIADVVQRRTDEYKSKSNEPSLRQMISIDQMNSHLLTENFKHIMANRDVSSLWIIDFDSSDSIHSDQLFKPDSNSFNGLFDPKNNHKNKQLPIHNSINFNDKLLLNLREGKFSSSDFKYIVNLNNHRKTILNQQLGMTRKYNQVWPTVSSNSNLQDLPSDSVIKLNWPLIHSMTKHDRRLLRHLNSIILPKEPNGVVEKINTRIESDEKYDQTNVISAPQYWKFIILELWKEILFLSIIVAVLIQITIYYIRRKIKTALDLVNTNDLIPITDDQLEDQQLKELKELKEPDEKSPQTRQTKSSQSPVTSNRNVTPKNLDFDSIKLSSIQPIHNDGFPLSKSRFENDFEHIEEIGFGGFGRVFKAKNKINGCFYAIKRIEIPECEMAKKIVLREVTALSNLEHSGIVRFYNAWFDVAHPNNKGLDCTTATEERSSGADEMFNHSMTNGGSSLNSNSHNISTAISPYNSSDYIHSKHDKYKFSLSKPFKASSSKRLIIISSDGSERVMDCESDQYHKCFHTNRIYLFIQMQLCLRDTLREWLFNNIDNRSKTFVLDIFKQILLAVSYLHDKGLVHRDLKPSNIFFAPDGTVKIGDFGLVSCFTSFSSNPNTSILHDTLTDDFCSSKDINFVGTELYMSPELISNQPYDFKIDIYALGLIFIELLLSFHTQMERHKTLIEAKKGNYSQSLKRHQFELEIIHSMISVKPQQRPTAKQVYEILQNHTLSGRVVEHLNGHSNEP